MIELVANDFNSVHCVYSAKVSVARLEAIRRGAAITLYGVVHGADAGEPVIGQCQLDEPQIAP